MALATADITADHEVMVGRALAVGLLSLLVACGSEDAASSSSGSSGSGAAGGSAPTEIEAGLLDYPCEAGQLELDDGTCQDAGIPQDACPEGFAADGKDGCLPVLPTADCAAGTMALPGETVCRPVAPCGTAPWEGIPVDADTQYVDASFVGVSDGSATAPWTTIPVGVSAAAPGAVVAIAPGTYGGVTLTGKPAKLWGSCPEEVELVPEPGFITVAIEPGADQSELHRLSLTGISTLVYAEDVQDVVIDECWLHDTEYMGTYVFSSPGQDASVTIRRSLLEGLVAWGAAAWASTLAIEESVIRNVAADIDGNVGFGVRGWLDELEGKGPIVSVSRSLVEHTRAGGIRVDGSLFVTSTAVRDVEPVLSTQGEGAGIWSRGLADFSPDVVVDGASIERTHWMGLNVSDGDLEASRVTVRGVEQPPANPAAVGIAAVGVSPGRSPVALLREVSVEDIDDFGMAMAGVTATLEGVAVRDVIATSDFTPSVGLGISFEYGGEGQPAIAFARGLVVERTESFGLAVIDSELDVESIYVRDIRPNRLSDRYGRGIGCEVSAAFPAGVTVEPQTTPRLTLRHARVEQAHEAGLTVVGGDADVTSLWVSDVVPPPVSSLFNQPPIAAGALLQVSLEQGTAGSVVLRDSLIEDVDMAGVVVGGIAATIERTIVRDVAPIEGVGLGDGIVGLGLRLDIYGVTPAELTVSSNQIEGSARAGLALFESFADVSGSRFLCNDIHLNGESGEDQPFALVDAGGNACGLRRQLPALQGPELLPGAALQCRRPVDLVAQQAWELGRCRAL